MSQNTAGTPLLAQGRIVWVLGNLFAGKPKVNRTTKAPMIDQRTGLQIVEYGFGLAIPKIDPRTGAWTPMFEQVWAALHREPLALYPNGQIPPSFAYKFKDGDVDRDENGVPYNTREGYANHIVLACTTRIPIKFFRFEGGNNILVNDGIKNGDYVNAQLNIVAHPKQGENNPGLYLNPSAVQLIQPGKEIINTPSGDQMFGAAAPTYQGEVIAPVAPAMPSMVMPAPAAYPQAAPAMPAPAAPAPIAPHHGVLPQHHQPQHVAPAAPAYPAAPAAPAYPQAAPAMPAGNYPPVGPAAYPSMPAAPAPSAPAAYPGSAVPPIPYPAR